MSEKRLKRKLKIMKLLFKIIAFLIVIFANVCEVVAVQQVLNPMAACFGAACFAHLFAALLVTLGFFLYPVEANRRQENEQADSENQEGGSYSNPIVVPAFFIAFFIPVFGTFTASIMGFLLKPRQQNESEIFQDYINYVKTIKEDWPRFDKLSEDQLILKMLEVEPVVDAINSTSKTSVWGSIDNLSRRADSGAVSLIRDTIRKNDAEIKFLASIGLEKMEDSFQERMAKAEREFVREQTISSAIGYLQVSIQYLKSGLSSVELNKGLLQKLFSCCDKVLSEEPENTELSFFKAQLLFFDGQKEASLKLIEEILKVDTLKNEMLLDTAKIVFACGDLEKTLVLLEKIGKTDRANFNLEADGIEIELEELLEFWFPEKVKHA